MTGERVIDARGLTVAPGFIDPHTHSGDDLASEDPRRRLAANHLMQGVTTIFVGNDGGGDPDVGRALARFAALGTGPNVAAFVGFGPVRREVVGEADRRPNAAELAAMRRLVAKGMCEGAVGFSAGLFYVPQRFAETGEVVALASEAGARGGVYDTHLRDEGSDNIGLLPAVREAIEIGRKAGIPVHIAHVKALGADVHGQSRAIIAEVERARAAGVRVTADQYPWEASGTRISSALVPSWAMDGGRQALRARLADPAQRRRIEAGMRDKLRRRGGPASILITGGPKRGQTLEALAAKTGADPVQAAIAILETDGDAAIASFNMNPADVDALAVQPWVVTGSDASEGHPRRFGSFAEGWRRFVRDKRLMSAGEFVHRSSFRTAQIFGLEGRGAIRAGNFADVVILDPDKYRPNATYETPTELSEGVRTVLVNGRITVENGRPTGLLAGRAIAKPRSPRWTCPS